MSISFRLQLLEDLGDSSTLDRDQSCHVGHDSNQSKVLVDGKVLVVEDKSNSTNWNAQEECPDLRIVSLLGLKCRQNKVTCQDMIVSSIVTR